MFKNLNFQIDETNTVIFTICTNQPLQQIYIITSTTNLLQPICTNQLAQPTSTSQLVRINWVQSV